MSTLRLFNTLSRKIEAFRPNQPGFAGMYSCGPTVYHFAHIGNMRTYISADILKRTLAANGFEVKHIMNITDVGHLTSDEDTGEDKMEKGSAREGKSVWDIAAYYTDAFIRDSLALNILPPSEYTKASDFIAEQTDLVKKLESLGYAYAIEGDGIYYDTSKFPSYGALGGQDIASLRGGARIGDNPFKRNPADFALWKFSPRGARRQMEWDSPWGAGFPGWHIECSAMAIAKLGEHLDIHTGGVDHIKVHHTNEIAQSEPVLGHKWCNYWVHMEHMNENGGKMSKSGESFLTLTGILERGFDALDFRYFCLGASYRSQIAFSFDALAAARNARAGVVRRAAELFDESGKPDPAETERRKGELLDDLNDDLNTSKALAHLHELLRDGRMNAATKLDIIHFADGLLGLRLIDEAQAKRAKEEVRPDGAALILLQERNEAKLRRDFAKADEIRGRLEEMGYAIEDLKSGAKIRRKQGTAQD